jgi:hypothetical protein
MKRMSAGRHRVADPVAYLDDDVVDWRGCYEAPDLDAHVCGGSHREPSHAASPPAGELRFRQRALACPVGA